MKPVHIIICLFVLAALIWLNQISGGSAMYGGLTWVGWASIALLVGGLGFVVLVGDSARAFGCLVRATKRSRPHQISAYSAPPS